MSNFSTLFLINGQILCVFGSACQEDDTGRETSEFFDAGFFFKYLSLLKRSAYLSHLSQAARESLEKAMAPHSSTLAWKIPWTEQPGRLQSMGSLGVRHDWATWLSLFTFRHWRRKWQPTPVFLPGGSQGWGSLVGCHLWGCTESVTPEAT